MKFRFSFRKIPRKYRFVTKKYRHAGFSYKNMRQLTDFIEVAPKNPTENPAKTFTDSITNQRDGSISPCWANTKKTADYSAV